MERRIILPKHDEIISTEFIYWWKFSLFSSTNAEKTKTQTWDCWSKGIHENVTGKRRNGESRERRIKVGTSEASILGKENIKLMTYWYDLTYIFLVLVRNSMEIENQRLRKQFDRVSVTLPVTIYFWAREKLQLVTQMNLKMNIRTQL